MSGEDAKKLVAEVREVCPALAHLNDAVITSLVGRAIQETNQTIAGIEARISEAGSIPGDIVLIIVHYAAIVQIIEGLPASNERRMLLEAGRKVGAKIAEQFGDKIRRSLEKNVN